jgi:ABC-type arginine/histidine transport system permease subunit
MNFLADVWELFDGLNWVRVFVTVLATLVAVVLGIWFPARMLEAHTNQPLARPVWYVAGTLILVMIYVCMYGYGQFWTLYAESPETQQLAPLDSD